MRLPDITGVGGIFCKIYSNNIKYILGAVYRPPSSSVAISHHLKEYFQSHVKAEDRIVMAGDFNFPNIDWSNFSTQLFNLMESEMLDQVFNLDLMQVVNEPTRNQHNSASILDLFFFFFIAATTSCGVATGIADHKAVLLTLGDVFLNRPAAIKSFPNF